MDLKRRIRRIPIVNVLYDNYGTTLYRVFVGVCNVVGFDYVNFFYDKKYYENNLEISEEGSGEMVDLLVKMYSPQSLIDIGCGNGIYLRKFQDRNIKIKGIDGSKAAISNSLVSNEFLELHDLRKKYTSKEKYDLAICMEVAEHIENKSSELLVETLASLSKTVVFTAAPPGQGGTGHINEQPAFFWKKLFKEKGMGFDSQDTKK